MGAHVEATMIKHRVARLSHHVLLVGGHQESLLNRLDCYASRDLSRRGVCFTLAPSHRVSSLAAP